MRRPLMSAILLSAALVSPPAVAQTTADAPRAGATQPEAARPEIAGLLTALGLDALMPVIRTEGKTFAESLEADMFPGRSNARWLAALDRIYNSDRMSEIMRNEVAARLSPEIVAPLMTFFTSERGKRIVELEVAARIAMMDEAVEATSRDQFDSLRRTDDPRVALLEEFVEANDLVEMNVAGALNSNLAFSFGLLQGDAYNGTMTEEEILADIWSEEESIRQDTTEWIFSYLALAYQPLPDDDLERYIELSNSPAGQALNTALFAGFDKVFTQISADLGQVVARMMAGEDI